MLNFTNRELALIAVALDAEENERPKRKRKAYWVHEMFKQRKKEGEYWTARRHLLADEKKFFSYYHMPQSVFYNILSHIEDSISKQNTRFREAITPEEKLAVTLKYLTSGTSVRNLSTSFRLGETTIRSIIKEVCKAVIDKMMSVYMPTPTAEDWEKITEGFNDRWNFPNCIGAIDGKHINIIAPPNSGSLYYNYKKHFSIVLLAIVDDRYRFTVVDIGAYGKNSDGGIFASSKIGKRIQNNRFNIPSDKALPGTNVALPHVFVGDEAFPLQKNIMRPYSRSQQLSQDQKEFNNRLSRARKVVEDAFGILYQKFEIYNKNIRLNPDMVDNVVLTTCILHNVMRTYNIESNEEYCSRPRPAHHNLHQEAFNDLRHIGGNTTAAFKSSVGQLPWNT
ncbi:uncharacterized protein LOC106138724 [Amyelois transitella]|uniref:uncharacterized protein LOC106138724 n=1 Tax=Amyelois transitella TaxID=680683 RepID=UPI00298F9687|nr:uncharacterized protein LOC106138724 [Amyelois transitella]